MSANDWLSVISSIKSKAYKDEVPSGFKTIAQLRVELKMPRSTLQEKCKTATEEGKMEEKEFTIKSGSTIKKVKHYKIIK